MKRLLLIIGLLLASLVQAQEYDQVTLSKCQDKAIINYPLSSQFDLLNSAHDLKQQSLNTNYLPRIDVNAQATYQSDVTKLPIDIPMFDIPEPPKDRYGITLDINQAIYDGGITSKQKEIEDVNLEIEHLKVDLDLYNLKDRVSNFFFNIIILKQNREIIEILKEDINEKLKLIGSGIKYGVALKKDADMLRSEVLKLEQKIDEIDISLSATRSMLSELTGDVYDDRSVFLLPEVIINPDFGQNRRLENRLFNLNKEKLNASKNLINGKSNPKIVGFGQAGYGKPGLNMLGNDFQPYYMVGARFSWNFWNWGQNKKDRQILDLQQNIIENQKNTFNKNLILELTHKFAEISKFTRMIENDQVIIDLKTEIAKVSSSQFDNGIITSTDYLQDKHAETEARLNLGLHKVLLVKAKIDFLTSKGEL